jgi:hypothetical protein
VSKYCVALTPSGSAPSSTTTASTPSKSLRSRPPARRSRHPTADDLGLLSPTPLPFLPTHARRAGHAATCQGGQPVLLNTQDVHSSVIAPAPQRARDDSLPSMSIQGMASTKCTLAEACTCALAELQGQTAQNRLRRQRHGPAHGLTNPLGARTGGGWGNERAGGGARGVRGAISLLLVTPVLLFCYSVINTFPFQLLQHYCIITATSLLLKLHHYFFITS